MQKCYSPLSYVEVRTNVEFMLIPTKIVGYKTVKIGVGITVGEKSLDRKGFLE